MTPRGKCHFLLLSKTFICILLQSNQSPPSKDRAPTQQLVYKTTKDSSSSGFSVFGQKVQNIDKNACRQMFKVLEPFRKEVVVDKPSKDNATTVLKFFSCHKKISTPGTIKGPRYSRYDRRGILGRR
jgi:hypothetical protein